MTALIVVADEREAFFYGIEGANGPLDLVSRIEDSVAQLHDRDLESDRPGRAFDSTSSHRHAMDGERSTRRHHQTDFARRIAKEIDQGRQRREFERFIVIAEPHMLGLIRDAVSDATRPLIVAEIAKDLVHADPAALKDHVPQETLRRATSTLTTA